MKILVVRAENLASHERFEIDFTSSPLKDAGLYAITGPTGAGKSTILDAICLALYNDTPRIKDAERDNILDVSNNVISLGDPRNILRKGTASGFTEVEFEGLDSKRYKARWSVSRSRSKTNGKLQLPQVSLTDLTTARVIADQKGAFKKEIERLVGLTFEQFTRTVMLAQGDFATFLKSDKNEKAELLEKLTGTDIYSRISSVIYEKSKVADKAFDDINSKIAGIELLDEKTLELLDSERETLVLDRDKNLVEVRALELKLEWFNILIKYKKEKNEAVSSLESSLNAQKIASPRVEQLSNIDKVQEIRDAYKAMQQAQKAVGLESAKLKDKKEDQVLIAESIKSKANLVKEKLNAYNDFEQAYIKLQPEIKLATEVDVRIESAAEPIASNEKELDVLKQKEKACLTDISKLESSIDSMTKELSSDAKWLEENAYIESISPKVELILANVDAAVKANVDEVKNISEKQTILRNLNQTAAELEKLKEEEERLQKILSLEVLELRKSLVEGEACPVCGSTEHHVAHDEVEAMKSKALEDARARIKKGIAEFEPSIQLLKDELVKVDVLIENSSKTYTELYTKLAEDLKDIQDWQDLFSQGSLIDTINTLINSWQEKVDRKSKIESQIGLDKQSLIEKSAKLLEFKESIKAKEEVNITLAKALENLKIQRLKLLEGKAVAVVETQMTSKSKSLKGEYDRDLNEYNYLVNNEKGLSGEITQLEQLIKSYGTEIVRLTSLVEDWKAKHPEINDELLISLLTKSIEWIKHERGEIVTINNAVISAKATLNERMKALTEHSQSEHKLGEDENIDMLNERKLAISEIVAVKNKRLTEIDALILNHKDGEKKIAIYKQDLEETLVIKTDWAKLTELFGSADGKKFRIIAQGYTLDLLLYHANYHLKDIAPRYVLERVSPESLALQIKDLDMASDIRPVNTLSGGESFLVSLALALGLSSLSSGEMSVESLFIDEGFGSLDQDTLAVAMDTLDKLQASGRKIGVISHVEEMKERITTQIQVHKSGNGSSRIIVV